MNVSRRGAADDVVPGGLANSTVIAKATQRLPVAKCWVVGDVGGQAAI